MKFFSNLIFVLFSIFLLSCDVKDNAVSITESSDNIAAVSLKPTINPIANGFEIIQLIDGSTGGSITFDTVYVDSEGDSIQIHTKLLFLPKSFSGLKEIKIIPDLNTGSVRFVPKMIFDKPAFLDLSYSGVDLAKLGFDSNSKIDFVYLDDSSAVEYTIKNECKIIWNKSLVYVKKAQLPHFSRYAFIRKSL